VFAGYTDGFGDTIRIHSVWQRVDPEGKDVRIPEQGAEVVGDLNTDGFPIGNDDGICGPMEVCIGNLHPAAIFGNAACTDEDTGAGRFCNVITGQHCTLPCILGPGKSILQGLPGEPQPGYIIFFQAEYLAQADDPDRITVQTTVLWEDLCDSPSSGSCASLVSLYQSSGSVAVSRCEDGDACTIDVCEVGECRFEPVTCDDGDHCTEDSCDPTRGACVHDPLLGCSPLEGCDASFWARSAKRRARLREITWPPGLTPNSGFCEVFDYDDAACPFPDANLLGVLKARRSDLNDLGRQVVAALLNAASIEINYELTVAEVMAMLHGAYPSVDDDYQALTLALAQYNEAKCPPTRRSQATAYQERN
jgi:hypothetical protein